jgi:hypothetical protein
MRARIWRRSLGWRDRWSGGSSAARKGLQTAASGGCVQMPFVRNVWGQIPAAIGARICRKISQDIPPAKHSGNLGSFDLTVPRLLEAGCATRMSSARILPSAPHRIRIRKMTTGTSCSTLVSTANGCTSTRAWTHHDHEEEGRTGRRKPPSRTKALAPG